MGDIYGRTGTNPYLDQLEKEATELKSARLENREPDFSLPNLMPTDRPQDSAPNAFEVDFSSPQKIDSAINRLQSAKDAALDKSGSDVGLTHDWVGNPIMADQSVNSENVGTPNPSVPTGNSVESDNGFLGSRVDPTTDVESGTIVADNQVESRHPSVSDVKGAALVDDEEFYIDPRSGVRFPLEKKEELEEGNDVEFDPQDFAAKPVENPALNTRSEEYNSDIAQETAVSDTDKKSDDF